MRAFIAGWFAHARNKRHMLPEEAWIAYRLIEGDDLATEAQLREKEE